MIVVIVLIMKNKLTVWMARFVMMIVESVSVQIPWIVKLIVFQLSIMVMVIKKIVWI